MAEKLALSIVLRTVDQATAGVRAFKARIDRLTAPVRELGARLKGLAEESGIGKVADGFRSVGGAVKGLGEKLLWVGGAAAAAVVGVMSLIGHFDDLGDLAERLGVSVDFLASMRHAAERSGASVEELDGGLKAFIVSLGAARAGTGRMNAFLQSTIPSLLAQLKAAKSNEAAFLLLGEAMSKITDPAKRAKLAAAALGDAALAPLLTRGPKGIKDLQDEFKHFAGSQEEAAEAAGKVDDELKKLKAAGEGVKAAIVVGLAPAIGVVVKQLAEWFVVHREDVKQWASDIGSKLPDAIAQVVSSVRSAVQKVTTFVDKIGGLKVALVALAAYLVGPLVSSFVSLGATMLATPFGAMIVTLAALTAGLVVLNKELRNTWELMDPSHELLLEDATVKPGETVAHARERFVAMHPELDTPENQKKLDEVMDRAAAGRGQLGPRRGGAEDPAAEARALQERLHGLNPRQRAEVLRATVKVDFANAPPGTRVTADPRNTADVDMTVGYNMLGGVW